MDELPSIDDEGQARWIAEQTLVPLVEVRRLLALEFEFMVGVGIIDLPDYEFQVYDPETLREESPVVDIDRFVVDAERLLGIPSDVALKVYEAEYEFLEMRGLAVDVPEEGDLAPKPSFSKRFRDALVYGAEIHGAQIRKGGTIPYVGHLLIVTGTVIEWGGDEDMAIAAMLHDAIEDQPNKNPREEIPRRFGERVAAMVEGLSDSDVIPKPPWGDRKKAYFQRLKHESKEVVLISCADKLANARAILNDFMSDDSEVWTRFSISDQGAGPQLWYYKNLLKIYEDRLGDRYTRELRAVVEEIAARASVDLQDVKEPIQSSAEEGEWSDE